jgi:hypothetical protein
VIQALTAPLRKVAPIPQKTWQRSTMTNEGNDPSITKPTPTRNNPITIESRRL